MSKRSVAIVCLSALLALTVVRGYYAVEGKNNQIAALENELSELREKEKRSAIDKEISRQLEEIAFQQETVSDERRQEAERQSEIAKRMTQKAEEERLKAIAAQHEAVESEKKTLIALENAENQRKIAVEKQKEAEYSKCVVDTLSFLGLGRSLASLSATQYLAGEKDLAKLLAAASCYFTEHYNGDMYEPSVFKALALAGGGSRNFQPGEGSISASEFLSDGSLISVSTYGEIFHCADKTTKTIFNDKSCHFRDLVLTENGTGYALSLNGEIVKIKNNVCTRIPNEGLQRTFKISRLKSGNLILAGSNQLALFDTNKEVVVKVVNTSKEISCLAFNKVFDISGAMYVVSENLDLKQVENNINGIITAYTETLNEKFVAYGTKEGVVYFKTDNTITELTGHRSKITELCFTPYGLLSSSLDKTLKLWTANSGKVEPVTVHTAQNWVMCLSVSKDFHTIVCGDAGGTIAICPISVGEMLQSLKNNFPREFTEDEWNYYIGKNIPYTTIKDKL